MMAKSYIISSYSENGNKVKTYKTIANAARDVGVAPPNIGYALKNPLSQSGGRYWRKGAEPLIEPPCIIDLLNKDGSKIGTCYSVKAVARTLDCSTQAVHHVLCGHCGSLKGVYLLERGIKRIGNDGASSEYINPHTESERQTYRNKVREIVDELESSDWKVTEKVKEFYVWEKEYSSL